MPLRLRLSLWYGSALALILVAFSTVLYFVTARSLRDALDQSLEETAAAAVRSEARDPNRLPNGLRKGHVVTVDAGHGGVDPGNPGLYFPRGLKEKHITLELALLLRDELRQRGVKVVMTRSRDTLIDLYQRGSYCTQECDLFISIHINSLNKRPGYTRVRGFETFFLAEAKTEDSRRVQDMENESVKFETGANAPKGDPLSFIITDMAQNEHLRESSDLAQTIQQGLIDVHPGPNRGVNQANFAVLRGSYMPAVLVELGFGSNQSEATYLSDQDNQRALARNIAESVIAYLANYESRIGGTR